MLGQYSNPIKTLGVLGVTSSMLPGFYLCMPILPSSALLSPAPCACGLCWRVCGSARFSRPTVHLCDTDNIYPDPRVSIRPFYNVSTSFTGSGTTNFDCCVSLDVDFFGECFTGPYVATNGFSGSQPVTVAASPPTSPTGKAKPCPVAASYIPSVSSVYSGWSVQFSCLRYALPVADMSGSGGLGFDSAVLVALVRHLQV